MNALTPLLRRLNTATPRERAGLAAVSALLAGAVALWAFDWDMRASAEATLAREQMAQTQADLARVDDAAFQESLSQNANKVWRWSLVQASEGVARAQAVAAVEALALQAGLGDASVSVDPAPAIGSASAEGGVTPITLTLNAGFEWSSFLAFLQVMREADISLSIDSIEVGGVDAPTFTMTLRAPFLHETAQP